MKEMFFISGLPRSGSTLLSSILTQNSEIYSGVSSPVYGMICSLIHSISTNENDSQIKSKKRKEIIKGIFESYYSDKSNKIIFDTSREWTSKTSILKSVYPSTKIICCVRDIKWILDSFEKILHGSKIYGAYLTDNLPYNTMHSRCDALMDIKTKGLVATPYYCLEEGLLFNPEMIMLVEYDSLCKNPEKTMKNIYNFIGKPYFEHDFNNVEYKNEEYDRVIGVEGLHDVRKKVSFEKRKSILPNSIIKQYLDKEFWRTPTEIKFPETITWPTKREV